MIADGDDSVIGRQTLNVINALYQDPNRWYVYTSYVEFKNGKLVPGQASLDFEGTTDEYRYNLDVWTTSHIRSWRKKLTNAVPL